MMSATETKSPAVDRHAVVGERTGPGSVVILHRRQRVAGLSSGR